MNTLTHFLTHFLAHSLTHTRTHTHAHIHQGPKVSEVAEESQGWYRLRTVTEDWDSDEEDGRPKKEDLRTSLKVRACNMHMYSMHMYNVHACSNLDTLPFIFHLVLLEW